MKHIGVLIDFSDLSQTSVEFAKSIAKRSKARVTFFHAFHENEDQKETLQSKFQPFIEDLKNSGIACGTDMAFGDYDVVLPRILSKAEVELVIIGTHGIRGIKQFLFGSNTLSLVQKLPIPCLVVQKNSPIPHSESSVILFPMSPHENFMEEVLQTANISKVFKSKVLIYTIIKSDMVSEEQIELNKKMACQEFKKLGVQFEVIDEPATTYSFGYGKQIVQYANAHHVDFISVMSHVSSDLAIMGNTDKEKILLNESFIPVFAVNN